MLIQTPFSSATPSGSSETCQIRSRSAVRAATCSSSVWLSRCAGSNRRAFSMRTEACEASPAISRSVRCTKRPGAPWPKNRPPTTSPERSVTEAER
jgi:hypothetical protein